MCDGNVYVMVHGIPRALTVNLSVPHGLPGGWYPLSLNDSGVQPGVIAVLITVVQADKKNIEDTRSKAGLEKCALRREARWHPVMRSRHGGAFAATRPRELTVWVALDEPDSGGGSLFTRPVVRAQADDVRNWARMFGVHWLDEVPESLQNEFLDAVVSYAPRADENPEPWQVD